MPHDGFPRARAAAERAIALDPDIPDAHVSISLERLFWARDWPGAEREMKRAIELNPKLALAHSFYSLILITTGRFDEALAEAQLATELDPLSLVINMSVAWVHHFSGNHRAAVDEARRIRELAPNFAEAGNVLIASYELLGRFRGSRRPHLRTALLRDFCGRIATAGRLPGRRSGRLLAKTTGVTRGAGRPVTDGDISARHRALHPRE